MFWIHQVNQEIHNQSQSVDKQLQNLTKTVNFVQSKNFISEKEFSSFQLDVLQALVEQKAEFWHIIKLFTDVIAFPKYK